MAQKKILICDDEPQLRELIASRLCSSGYAVVEASDGLECMRLIDSARPDVVLLDISMPKASGIDVLKKLADEGLHIPVIVLSGASGAQEASQLKNLGQDHFMQKPFAIRELIKKIDQFCHP